MVPRGRSALLAGLLALAACGAPELLLSKVPATCGTPAFCAAASRTASAHRDFAALARYLRRACDQRDRAACKAAMGPLTDGSGFVHGAEVRPLLELDCNAGAADACNALGQILRGDDEVAAEWLWKGCALGSGAACHDFAHLMLSGAISRLDRQLAAALEGACKAGFEQDCGPVPPDPRRRRR